MGTEIDKKEELPSREEGVNPSSMIERAEAVAKRMEEANLRAEELLKKNTEIYTRTVLGGRSEAGTAPTPTPVITDIQRAKALMEGKFI